MQTIILCPNFNYKKNNGRVEFIRTLEQQAQNKGLNFEVFFSPQGQGFAAALTSQEDPTPIRTYQDALAQIYNYHPKKHHTVAPKPDIEVHLL